jgi:hypothetical protein
MADKLVVGCGYLGRRIAALWCAQNHRVFAMTRSTARADEWRARGLQPILCDGVPGTTEFRGHHTQLRRDWSLLDLGRSAYDLVKIDAIRPYSERPRLCAGKIRSGRSPGVPGTPYLTAWLRFVASSRPVMRYVKEVF